MLDLGGACLHHFREVPGRLGHDVFLDLPDGVGDVAHHFDLREIDRVHFRRAEGDMDHLRAAPAHEEGRLFDHVMADIDDHVGGGDGGMDEIAR